MSNLSLSSNDCSPCVECGAIQRTKHDGCFKNPKCSISIQRIANNKEKKKREKDVADAVKAAEIALKKRQRRYQNCGIIFQIKLKKRMRKK